MYSIVILTKNEEINLQRCLESLPKECDIVVLDSGSTDKTKEIALELSARFFCHIPQGKFLISEQRNWALKNCELKFDWVFFIDADETMDDPLRAEIIRCIGEEKYNAYKLTPKYMFWGKWLKLTQGYPNWHDRLMKKDEVWLEGGVWEHFCNSAKVGYIDIPYNHYANSKGFFDWLERHKRYSNWDAHTTMAFLESKDATSLNTTRKLRLRLIATKFWYLRPWFRFFHMYILRGGFLEGWKSFMFCLHYFIYEMMVVIQIIELKRIKENKDL